MSVAPHRIDRSPPDHDQAIAVLREALTRLRYGAITLTVHDGRVAQMEITEKRRFDA